MSQFRGVADDGDKRIFQLCDHRMFVRYTRVKKPYIHLRRRVKVVRPMSSPRASSHERRQHPKTSCGALRVEPTAMRRALMRREYQRRYVRGSSRVAAASWGLKPNVGSSGGMCITAHSTVINDDAVPTALRSARRVTRTGSIIPMSNRFP